MASLFATLGGEALARPATSPLGAWLHEQPMAVAIDLTLGAVIALALLAVLGRVVWALAAYVLLLGVATLSHLLKLETLGRPLFPTDVMLFREGLAVLPTVGLTRWLTWLAPGLVLLLVSIVRRGPRVSWRARGLVVAGVLVVALGLGAHPHERLAWLGVKNLKWVQPQNYLQNGLVLAFTLNAGSAAVIKPADYGKASVKAAMAVRPPAPALPPRAGEAPHVIVVMSESFFDPTALPGVKFVQDPVPTLRRLQRDASSGTLFSPVFGGGTANTEFEFLTGHSMQFLPAGSVAYQQYIRRRHPSLAEQFAREGYRTTALHSFHRWFWERDQVYQHLGFERFLAMEDLPDLVIDGKYASDAVLTKQILEELKSPDPRPQFIFAVSMEAHGPYEPHRYPDHPTWLTDDAPLDDEARGELDTYLTAVNHADRELAALITALQASRRPVWVVFFGDHLPSLRSSMKQVGVVQSVEHPTQQERRFLHQVPLVAWTNSGASPRQFGTFGATFLGPLLLELTGTPGTRYTDFLRRVRLELPAMGAGLIADARGDFYDELPPELQDLTQAWWTLEYDLLFGEQFQLEAEEG
ncbi:MAG TPA: LTA synthase family protein [Archangium sp.]